MSIEARVAEQDQMIDQGLRNQSPLDALAQFDYSHPRTSSLRFKEVLSSNSHSVDGYETKLAQAALNTINRLQPGMRQLETLEAKGWQKTGGDLVDIGKIRNALTHGNIEELRRYGYSIYEMYAKDDIIDGLSAIDHPALEMVIAICLDDLDEAVRNHARKKLEDKGRAVHEETLGYLLNHPDHANLALDLVQNNPRVGFRDGEVYPVVANTLDGMLQSTDIQNQRRAAIITSLLHERTNGNLRKANPGIYRQAMVVLSEITAERIASMHLPDSSITPALVDKVVQANLEAARNRFTSSADRQSTKVNSSEVARKIRELFLPSFPEDNRDVLTALNSLVNHPAETGGDPNDTQESIIATASGLLVSYDRYVKIAQIAAQEKIALQIQDELTTHERTEEEEKREKQDKEKANEDAAERRRLEDEAQARSAVKTARAIAEGNQPLSPVETAASDGVQNIPAPAQDARRGDSPGWRKAMSRQIRARIAEVDHLLRQHGN